MAGSSYNKKAVTQPTRGEVERENTYLGVPLSKMMRLDFPIMGSRALTRLADRDFKL